MPPFQPMGLPANAPELLEKRKKEVRELAEQHATAQQPMDKFYVNQAVSTMGAIPAIVGKEYVDTYVKTRETLGRGRKRRKTLKRKSKKTKKRSRR